MQVKTYLGTLSLKQNGNHSHARYLIVATSDQDAASVLDAQASMYWCEPEDCEARDEGWYFYADMDAWAKANPLHPIGLATFWDLKAELPLRSSVPLDQIPSVEQLGTSYEKSAQALGTFLATKGASVSHSVLLHAIAAACGETNWQALRAKSTRSADALAALQAELASLKSLAWDVVNSCDDAGCDESLTVADSSSVEALREHLNK